VTEKNTAEETENGKEFWDLLESAYKVLNKLIISKKGGASFALAGIKWGFLHFIDTLDEETVQKVVDHLEEQKESKEEECKSHVQFIDEILEMIKAKKETPKE